MRVFKVLGITCALVLVGAVGWKMISDMVRSKTHQENRTLVKADLTFLHEELEKLDPTTIETITIKSLAPDPSVLNEDVSKYTFRNYGASDGTQESIRQNGMRYQGIVYQGGLAGAENLSITIEGRVNSWTPSPPRSKTAHSPASGASAEPASSGLKGQENKAQGK